MNAWAGTVPACAASPVSGGEAGGQRGAQPLRPLSHSSPKAAESGGSGLWASPEYEN